MFWCFGKQSNDLDSRFVPAVGHWEAIGISWHFRDLHFVHYLEDHRSKYQTKNPLHFIFHNRCLSSSVPFFGSNPTTSSTTHKLKMVDTSPHTSATFATERAFATKAIQMTSYSLRSME